MKLSLRHGGAFDAPPPPRPASALGRAAAWARESLAARAIAIGAGLVVLAALGSSAFAGDAVASIAVPALPGAPALGPPTAAEVAPTPSLAPAEIAALAPEAEPALDAGAGAASTGARASPDDPVRLNAATLEDLRRLPGVGPKRAQAILAVRARLGGRFRQIEDLLKVKGIGRATLKRLRPLVRLDVSPSPMPLDASAAT